MKFKYFYLEPELSCGVPYSLYCLQQKRELRIGPHFRLCGPASEAHLASEAIAERVREAILPRFQKRYGDDTNIVVLYCETNDPKVLKKIEADTAIVLERLEKGMLAPNKRP